jgi:hypothetical protein
MSTVGTIDEESPSCTVCLCEYEGGDEMRRLPCGHDFHQACIDKWMTQHTTCPICRVGLVPQVCEGWVEGGGGWEEEKGRVGKKISMCENRV